MKKIYFFTFLVMLFATNVIHAQQFELNQDITVGKLRGSTGAMYHNQAVYAGYGKVFLFEKQDNNQWKLAATLQADEGSDQFGISVGITQNRVIVADKDGSAFIFEKLVGKWQQTQRIVLPPNNSGENIPVPEVAISENDAFVSNPGTYNNGAGTVYVYRRNTIGTWEQTQELPAPDQIDGVQFGGNDVIVKGDRMAISAFGLDYYEERSDQTAYIFDKDGAGNWNYTATLKGYSANSDFAYTNSLAFSGAYASIGQYETETSDAILPGSLKIFENDASTWSQTTEFSAPDKEVNDYFSMNLLMDGDLLMATTRRKGSYVYQRSAGGAWENQQTIRDYYVAGLSGDDAIAHGPDPTAVYFFSKSANTKPIAVTGFNLVDAKTNQIIQSLKDGDVIDLDKLTYKDFNVLAVTEGGGVKSVALELKGAIRQYESEKLLIQRTENSAPYALFGDKNGDARNWNPEPGYYVLVAVPYTEKGNKGLAGRALSIAFNVIERGGSVTKPAPMLAANAESKRKMDIVFFLLDADHFEVLQEIRDEDVINLRAYGNKNFNILAKPREKTGSAVIEVRLPNQFYQKRTENKMPYTGFGDTKNSYRNWEPELGRYTLKTTGYRSDNAISSLGSHEIHFSIIDEPVANPAVTHMALSAFSIYPNPSTTEVNAKVSAKSQYTLYIYDHVGNIVYRKNGKGGSIENMRLNRQLPGIYMVVLETDGKRETQRLVIE